MWIIFHIYINLIIQLIKFKKTRFKYTYTLYSNIPLPYIVIYPYNIVDLLYYYTIIDTAS